MRQLLEHMKSVLIGKPKWDVWSRGCIGSSLHEAIHTRWDSWSSNMDSGRSTLDAIADRRQINQRVANQWFKLIHSLLRISKCKLGLFSWEKLQEIRMIMAKNIMPSAIRVEDADIFQVNVLWYHLILSKIISATKIKFSGSILHQAAPVRILYRYPQITHLE